MVLAMVAGCPGSGVIGPTQTPPTVTAASATAPSGNLTLNQAGIVTVRVTVLAGTGTVESVSANLSAVGGPAAMPLVFDSTTNLWSASLTVVPTVSGSRRVTVTAVDSNNLTSQFTATINVVTSGGGGNVPPQLSNATATGSLVAGFVSQVSVSVTATDADGTVTSVIADLSQVGGFNNQQLTQSSTNTTQWAFTGLVTPTATGTRTITFEAVDNGGATGTAVATILVVSATP